jgi:hypothetical protein
MRVRAALAAVAIMAVGGCADGIPSSGDQNVLEPKPTAARLDRARALPTPVYWLGPRYGRLKLTGVTSSRYGAAFSYGRPSCDSGCTYPLAVFSGPRRALGLLPGRGDRRAIFRVCFREMRTALLLRCPGEFDADLWTGPYDVDVQIDTNRVHWREVLHSLRPMNPPAASRPLLARPAPLTCSEFARLAPWFAVKLPDVLRPTGCL